MTFFRLRLLAPLCLALSLPLVSPQTAQAEQFRFHQLAPEAQALIRRAMRGQAEGGFAQLTLSVTVNDCPLDCNERVVGGMCYCAPNDGECGPGQTETTLGGEPACRIAPTTAEVIGGAGGPRPLEMMGPRP